MSKDWTGNKKSTFVTLGASNHTDETRDSLDYYATDPIAAEKLLEVMTFSPNIWECACGEGHLSEVFRKHGYKVFSTDVCNRGYKHQYPQSVNFLNCKTPVQCDIITNPPYKFAREFVLKALELTPTGYKTAMFLKLTFLEGKRRKELFKKHPPKYVYVSSSRIRCAKNGDFETCCTAAVAYGWFIWEKGYNGETIVRWFN